MTMLRQQPTKNPSLLLRSKDALRFRVSSLYPLLYRLEKSGWIQGRWVEKAGQHRGAQRFWLAGA
ncbi:MAG TPA: helix-turn-helix transcriptional regulator [Candidatus Angelobacter sp.]|nr:helix-turn-helix transcriptional regulator [Candidatus Angelobacter sp.]